jgi:predicted nucleotidyltransferase
MRNPSSNFAEVKFLDRDQVIRALRSAVREAKSRHPEIVRVWLFGSWVEQTWTADSDADLMVVVRQNLSGGLERSRYQIYTRVIPTDSLVYSESEFEELAREPSSFVAQNLSKAMEL